MRSLFFLTFLTVIGASANAQIDPSSALLLNTERSVPVRDSGLDSGRYTVRPRSDSVRTTPTRRQTVESSTATSGAATASASASAHSENIVHTETTATVVESLPPSQQTQQTVVPSRETAPVTALTPSPTATPAAQAAATSATAEVDGRRLTMIELSLAPSYFYNQSKSQFTNRNYTLNSPAFAVDANVWFSPWFGAHTSFVATSNAHISDALDGQRSVAISGQWFWAGLRARKYFGTTKLAPTLTFGVDYRDYELRVPSDSQMRAKLTTTGPEFSLESEIPSSRYASWTLGVTYSPKLQHRETSNAVDFSSGTSPSSSSVGVSLGARYRFDDAHSMFWKVSQTAEKNIFSGDTSVPDLRSGVIQHGVDVTNTMTLFQLGYTWAD